MINEVIHKSILFRIRKYKNIDGWLSDKEAVGLYIVSNKLPVKATVVEIGSWKGKSTYCIAMGLKDGKIFSIDPFNADGEDSSKKLYEDKKGNLSLFEQFEFNMKKFGVYEKIESLKGYSVDFINYFSKIDFLFIDGDHSIKGCLFDFDNYSEKISKGGFIALHDYYASRIDLGPTWVIKNRLLNNPKYRFFKQYDTLWIAQRL